MDLYLLRHGIAEDHAARDSERALTEEGRKKIKTTARALEILEVHFDLILTSPFVRARETAEIVARHLGLEKKMETCRHLAVGGDREKVIEVLKDDYREADSVLLVGHEPQMSGLIAWLVAGDDRALFTMKKGGLCRLQASRLGGIRSAALEWLLSPKQLCRIGES